MRGIYIAAVVILALVNLALGGLNIYYKTPPPDKVLKKTPVKEDISLSPIKPPERRADIPGFSALWEKNLFLASRGETAPEVANTPVNRGDLELVGVCKLGDTAVAIILSKSSPAPPGAPHASGGAPPGAAKPGTGPISMGEKHCYKQGQRLTNGFLIKEISSDFVLLSRGNEEMVLKIDSKNPGRDLRIAANTPPPAAAPAPATPVITPVNQPAGNPTPERPAQISNPPASAPGSGGKRTGVPAPPPPPPMLKTSDSKPVGTPPQNSSRAPGINETKILSNS